MANIINFFAWLIPLGAAAGFTYIVMHKKLSIAKELFQQELAEKEIEEAQIRNEVSTLLERLENAESKAAELPGLQDRLSTLSGDLEREKARLQGVASIDEAVKASLMKSAEEIANVKRESLEKEITQNSLVASLRLELSSLQETVRQRDLSLAAADAAYREQGLALKKVCEDYQEAVDRLRSYSSASLVIKRSKGVRASGVMIQNRKDLNGTGT